MTFMMPLSLLALKLVSREELSPGERQSPRNKAGDAVFESASQKPNSCLSYFEGLQGDNAADGYFCSQKTSKELGMFADQCAL